MISILCLESPSDRSKLLKDFDPMTQTWLVSDLKSKAYIQNELLTTHAVLPEESLLRASEFWKRLFVRFKPEYRIVSEGLATLMIGDWLKERGDWAQTPGASEMAYAHLSYLMPIFAHGSGIEGMKAWFAANPAAHERWGHWFVECFYLWNQFEKNHLAAPAWLGAHLMNIDVGEVWKRPLWVDLGQRMLTVETEIFANFSKQLSVNLIQPNPVWIDEYKTSMGAYDFLEVLGETKKITVPPVVNSDSSRITRKFSSPLGEAKDAVASIRKWVQAGVPLECIACVAPQIKTYEDTLRLLLGKERFPISEPTRADFSSFPDVHNWLCDLQVALENFGSGHLESAVYAGDSSELKFSEFIRLYKLIYDSDDLKRAKKVYDQFQARPQPPKKRSTSREFAEWALMRWGGGEDTRLIKLLDSFLSDGPAHLELNNLDWFSHLNNIAIKTEEKIQDSWAGIQMTDLHSSENLQATHVVLLGLNESALRRSRKLGILPRDLWSIQKELGFSLPLIEDVSAEFDAQWLLESRGKNFILMCSLSDWRGANTSPALIWIKNNLAAVDVNEGVHVPGEIMWGNLATDVVTSMKLELKGETDLKGRRPAKLSVSSIEDYLDCPFIYTAKKIFHCDDSEYVDIEIGHQTGGRLRHRILERLLERPLDWTESELEALVEEVSDELNVTKVSEGIWKSQRRRFVALARRFQEFEIKWRQEFPETKTIARELEFEIYFDPVNLSISTDSSRGILIRGSIDRVDEDSAGRVVIIDYKARTESLSSWNKWIENANLQLGFYADVVASGLTSLGAREVVGAFYMGLRDFERGKGFARADSDGVLFNIGRKKFGLDGDQQSQLFSEIRKTMASTIGGMELGRFAPSPRDKEICPDCRWNQLCRAVHLL